MKNETPPFLFLLFFRWYCHPKMLDYIEGDLMEVYEARVKETGKRKADIRFIIDVLLLFRPGIIRPTGGYNNLNNYGMLKSYFTIAFRNLLKNKGFSFINIFSLAIGLSSFLIIYIFISDELSFDSFHSKRDRIYRIYGEPHYAGSTTQKIALTMGWNGPLMANDFPEIKNFTRYWAKGKMVFKNKEKQFLVSNVSAVDSTFLDVFYFELVSGNASQALDQPNSVILTEETAAKFFTNSNEALGTNITIQGAEYNITGVIKSIPEQSHLRFDALLSMSTFSRTDKMFRTSWDGSFLNTYVELHPDANIESLEAKFPDFLVRHSGNNDLEKSITLHLQSLQNVHLRSTDIEHDDNNYRKFNGAYLKVFGITGAFVLLIACVNFMNLTTARASHRWKEIGVRKSLGAKKAQIFRQFIFESCLLAMLALALAVFIDQLLLPFSNQLIGHPLSLASFWSNPYEIGLVIVFTLGLGLLTGIYPSLFMTFSNTTSVLKGVVKPQRKFNLQNSLVVLQFGLAIALILSTLVISKQLSFMKNTDVGFEKDQIILIDMNNEVNKKFEVLKTEWLRSKYVTGVTASSQRIGNNFNGWGFKIRMDTGVYKFVPANLNVDFDYLKVYGIKLKDGRDFTPDFITDKGRAFIINETMTRELSLNHPVGRPAGQAWYENDSLGSIIGVAQDFNYNSLHNKIGMLAIVCNPAWGYEEISVKVNGAQAPEAVAALKTIWDQNITTYPFTYSFLDEHFNNLYRSDKQMNSAITILSVLAVIISCMGLFGLVKIKINNKIKEIGIRKVMGASISQITILLSVSFIKLVLLSFALAGPIVYYLLSKWLENFAYRISISPLIFLLGGSIAIGIALLTIIYQIISSARENPVNSLRSE